MSSKIMISSDEIVVCPKCSNKFPVEQGITRQTVEQHEKEYERVIQERSDELKEELSKEAAVSAEKKYKSQIFDLAEELSTAKEELNESEERIKKAKEDARNKAFKEFESERRAHNEELQEKDSLIKEFREKEIGLRREKKKLEDDKQNFELESQRKLDAAKKDIEKSVREYEAEKFSYKEIEYKKKLNDAQKANEELTQKLQQGSQQLQGEVLELKLERILQEAFPLDNIKEVAKGKRGADVLQCVYTQSGQICGTIIWEAKRARNWSDQWLQKLKDDRMIQNADIAVLVSTTMPKGCIESFKIIGDIWVVSSRVIRPIAETLRVMLIETSKLKLASKGRSEKTELIYNYLCSPNFALNIRSVIETFAYMKRDLDREKNAMNKTWKKRESQLERVAVSMSTMVGELQAIAQDSLPQLGEIDQLLLPGESDEE
jgi:hypothetical protein